MFRITSSNCCKTKRRAFIQFKIRAFHSHRIICEKPEGFHVQYKLRCWFALESASRSLSAVGYSGITEHFIQLSGFVKLAFMQLYYTGCFLYCWALVFLMRNVGHAREYMVLPRNTSGPQRIFFYAEEFCLIWSLIF